MGKRGPTAEELGYGQKWIPGPAPSRVGDSLSCWDINHKDKFRAGYSHIPKEKWERIFGSRGNLSGER